MTLFVFFTVLLAALTHAVWNALVKSTGDKLVAMTAVTLGHAPLALIALPFVPLPHYDSLIWLAFSIAAHTGYQFTLAQAYRLGDYTQVYPIARGTGPALVGLITTFIFGHQLSLIAYMAIFFICCGIFCLGFLRNTDGLRNPKALTIALITGCFIAAYSTLDGMGARINGHAISFVAWLTLMNALTFTVFIYFYNRASLQAAFYEGRKVMILGGSASIIAYTLVIWAMTQAPIAVITALRETSTIFALFIGVLFLKEKINTAKILATLLTACGVLLLRFAS